MGLEQLVAKLGLNIAPFMRGLDKARQGARGFANDARKEAAGSFGKAFGGAAVVGGIVAATKSVIDYADAISELSADLGVSTDFLQGFTANVAQNGGTTEGANASLTKFSQLVGEAASGSLDAQGKIGQFGISIVDTAGNIKKTDTLMLEMIDSISKLPTEAERASAALDVFGRTGKELLGVLAQGRKANEEFIASVDKLSEQSLRDLAAAKSQIENITRAITIGIGNAIGTVSKFFRILGAFSVTGSISGAIKSVNDEDASQAIKSKSRENVKTQAGMFDQLKNKIAKEREEQRRKEIAAEQKLGDEMQKNLDKLHKFNEDRKAAQLGLASAQGALAQRRGDRGRFTLEELATSGLRFSGKLRQEQLLAQQAYTLERYAEINRTRGYGDLSIQQNARAEEIRKGLTNLQQSERFPFADLTSRVDESNAELRRLNSMAATDGILIRPTNGQ